MNATKTFDLVAIGEPLIELNQRDPARPDLRIGFGGDTSNAVLAATRLGARCAYITQVGDDTFGESLLALWRREGVSLAGVRVLAGAPTGLYFVTHGADGIQGHQFSYRRAGSAASLMTPADLPRALVADARRLHVSGISMAISASACDTVLEAVAIARDAGSLVSFDLNFRPHLSPAARSLALARHVLRDCEVFFPSVDEIAQLTGIDAPEDIVRWSHDQGARAVVLKLGARGCLVSSGAGSMHIAGTPVTPVDATGAGDCFAGACLARLAAGATLAEAARFANVAAALSTRGYGAVDPLPSAAEVEAVLASSS